MGLKHVMFFMADCFPPTKHWKRLSAILLYSISFLQVLQGAILQALDQPELSSEETGFLNDMLPVRLRASVLYAIVCLKSLAPGCERFRTDL